MKLISESEAEGKLCAYVAISVFDAKKAKECGIEIKGVLIDEGDDEE